MWIKFLSLHMIPWCFHLRVMRTNLSCLQQQQQQRRRRRRRRGHQLKPEESVEKDSSSSIKLIKLDGLVKIYHQPIHASQLMLEFPKHLVCHSESFYIGQKIPALSEEDELQPGHKYFLLPKHFFQSVLSFVTIASFAASSPSSSSSNSYSSKQAFLKRAAAAASCQPFDIKRTPSGSLQIRVSDEFISKLMEEGKTKEEGIHRNETKGGVCNTPQLQKDYEQLVGYRQWKPKLETIRESERRRKLSSFGMKRLRKKSPSHQTHHHHDYCYSQSSPASRGYP
ncbi:uncharacterized protein LOC122077373 [Macadamia integrifolia]|uniref:uncharacterized protein LOC122077373 n=1 Tax=Macadamia integrifolia TaxID=60698 RepID=UPI001C4FAAE2|nr:uncharacterized protein LOC122077373 [Macadamia integrifolia]